MQQFNDPRFGANPEKLDDEATDAVLDGETNGRAVPDSYGPVIRLLRAVRRPLEVEDAGHVSAIAQAVREPGQTSRRNSVFGRKGLKVAGIAMGAVISMSGVAAASSGTLPDPIQKATSELVSQLGVEIPETRDEPVDETTTTTTVPETTTTTVPGDETTTTTTLPTSPITVPPVAKPEHPGAATCAAAREVEGAHGCSELAKEHAPGQQKKHSSDDATTTSTTSVTTVDDKGGEKGKDSGKGSDSGKGKSDDNPGKGSGKNK